MRISTLLLSIAFFGLSGTLPAQNCGCAEEGNCPFSFSANSNTQVCYEITDAFNNNLANPLQGVCGVSVRFRHGRVGNMNLTLTSPGGQQVQLIGTGGNCNTWTPIATWDVIFAPCGETCAPDTLNNCPYPCNFNGCPTDCPWANANYSGTYHPFAGCLENFNTGPANGQWCLTINNTAPFNGGAILDFRIILCDQSGILCCDADAGNLNFAPDVNACTGDSALLFSPNPLYGAIVPDPDEYGYRYAVFGQNALLALDSVPNLMAYSPGTYQVCGLSYLYADTAALPVPGTAWTPQLLRDTLTGPAPPFCGHVANNCIDVQIADPPLPTNLASTLCQGDTLFVGGEIYTQAGVYSDTLASYVGCDSIVNLTLTVLLPDTVFLTETLCPGSVFQVGDSTYAATGIYTNVFQNANGCDSTVFLDLTVLPLAATSLSDTICAGDSVWVGGMAFHASGAYTVVLLSYLNCDSTITLNLTVVDVAVSILPADTLTCQQPAATLVASASTSLGTLGYVWSLVGGTLPGGNTSPTLAVGVPGTYTVEVTAQGCTATDTVQVFQNADLPTALAFAIATDTLTCTVTGIQLDGSLSTGTGPLSWQWTALGGSTVPNPSSPLVTVASPDTYRLTVTDLNNGCTGIAMVVVSQNTIPPVANAGADTILSCTLPSVNLDGSASMPLGNISYQWSAVSGGNILPPANVPNPAVDAPGTYLLLVTDLSNGCRDSALVTVSVDTLTPNAIIDLPFGNTLTCFFDEIILDGTASTGSVNLSYQWLGNIATGQGTLLATAAQPGLVTLVLTDLLNGCTDSTAALIGVDTIAPIADAGTPDTLDCTDITADLGGPGTSIGPNFSYQWASSPGGSFTGPTQFPQTTADSAGTYFLMVTNIQNGCTALDSVLVQSDYQPPLANAGPDWALTCQVTEVTLDASGSTIVPFTTFQWFNSAGTQISNNVQLTVDYPDTFLFVIRFAFCESRDTVVVSLVSVPPVAHAGPDMELDCLNGQADLDGSGSDAGTDISYQWSGASPGASILSGETTPQPIVNAPGLYVLSVLNTATFCESTDTVLVTLDTAACLPVADAGADGLVNCYNDNLVDTLAASGSAGPLYGYQWTALSGVVKDASNPFAPVVEAGEYIFTVTNLATGLSAHDTVFVAIDTMPPVAELGPPILPLTCPELAGCYALDVSASSQGPGYAYSWETLDGVFCGPADMLNVEVQGPGVYFLSVMDLANGCVAQDAVLVQLLDFPAEAEAGPSVQIPCSDTTTILDGSASSAGGAFTYQWSSLGGEILSGGNTLHPVVAANNPQDTFYLTVTNTLNGCLATDFTVVFSPTGCFPTCLATASGPLDCDSGIVTLSAAGSSQGAGISYLWEPVTPGASLCGGEMTSAACADAAGIYQLTVTRTYPTGLQFSTTCNVQVTSDVQPPTANAGPDRNLTCSDNVLTINGNASSSGTNFTYLWSTPDGNILSGATTPAPQVNAPGTYFLLVTNTANTCTATDVMSVGVDTLHPVAQAGPGDQLSCTVGTVVLSGSSTPPGMLPLWTTADGDICAGTNTFSPVVCNAGTYVLTVTHPVNGCTATDFTVVTKDGGVPNADAGPDLHYTCTQKVFTLNASASGGPVLSYQWTVLAGGCINGPSNILQPTVACPGIYRLVVTDEVNGCTGISQMQVIADTLPPIANPGNDREINCDSLVVTLDGSGSSPAGLLDFVWSTPDGHFVSGETTPFPLADSAGTYILIVTNVQNQCKDTASVTVTLDANLPVVDAGPDSTLTCSRASFALNGTGSSSGPNIVYSWTHLFPGGGIVGGSNTPTPLINLPGVYVLSVEDVSNQCVLTDTVLVTMDTVAPVAVISPQQNLLVTCGANQLTLSGSQSIPSGGVFYQWQTQDGHIVGGSQSQQVTVDSGGSYLLTVTDLVNGCTALAAVQVEEDFDKPVLAFGPEPVLTCDSPQVQVRVIPQNGGGSVFSFAWSGPGTITQPDSPHPMVGQQGIYQVIVTDASNGCTASGSVLVTQNTQLPIAKAKANGRLDCENLSVEMSGQGSSTGDVTYQWTTPGTGTISDPTALFTQVDVAGWYYLTVRRLDNGCTATDSAEVMADAVPIEGALIRLLHASCKDPDGYIFIDSVFGGAPRYFYSLDGGIFITYPQFSYLDPGQHVLTIKDENGCQWTTSLLLLEPGEVLVDLGDDVHIRQGESVSLTALTNLTFSEIDTILWQNLPVPVECPSCLVQTVAPHETTTYRIAVVDTNGCMSMDRVTVFVNVERPFFAPTAFSPNGDGTNDRFLLFARPDAVTVRSMQIFDRWGNLVFAARDFPPNHPDFGWDGTFEGQPMNPAVFVWQAEVAFLDGTSEVFYGEVSLIR